MKSSKIVIVMNGEMILDVLTEGPAEYVMVNYETDGEAAAEICSIPQEDGSFTEAVVEYMPANCEATDQLHAIWTTVEEFCEASQAAREGNEADSDDPG